MNKLTGNISDKFTYKINVVNEPIANMSNRFTYKINIESGARGKSAYQLWLDEGNNGSIEDFFESIGGADSGTLDYERLRNKPSIESIELMGNKSFNDLGITIVSESDIENLF